MIIDALEFFQAWLCGEGLTSPGLMLDEKSLKVELENIDRVKAKAIVALEFDPDRPSLPRVQPGGSPQPTPIDDLSAKLLLLDDEDRRLMRSAIELFLEESDCLAAFVSPPVGLNDLRELLAQVPIKSQESVRQRPADQNAQVRPSPARAGQKNDRF